LHMKKTHMKFKPIVLVILFVIGLVNESCQTNAPSNDQPTQSTDTITNMQPVEPVGEGQAIVLPTYPGGEAALQQFLAATIRYPIIAQENGIEGVVVVQLDIDVDGSVTNVVVVQSSGDVSLDKEALRVISALPKWNPGTVDGQPAKFRYQIPITFRL